MCLLKTVGYSRVSYGEVGAGIRVDGVGESPGGSYAAFVGFEHNAAALDVVDGSGSLDIGGVGADIAEVECCAECYEQEKAEPDQKPAQPMPWFGFRFLLFRIRVRCR